MNRNSRGFSLIEIILVISILLVVTMLELQRRNEEIREQNAETVGIKMSQLEKAVASYVTVNYPYLQRLNFPAPGVEKGSLPTDQTGEGFPCPSSDNDKNGIDRDGLVLKCVANGASTTGYAFVRTRDPNCIPHATLSETCELSIDALVVARHLPVGWLPATPWGGSIRVFIKRVPPTTPGLPAECLPAAGTPAPDYCGSFPTPTPATASGQPAHPSMYEIKYMAITEEAWAIDDAKTNIRWKDLGIAARKIGATGGVSGFNKEILGMTTTVDEANGIYGGWKETSASWPLITKGQIVVVGGAKSSVYNKYFRRDGSLPATGVFNLNNNNIVGMRDAFLRGPETNIRNRHVSSLTPSWVLKSTLPVSDDDVIDRPACPENDGLTPSLSKYGVPKIKVTMQYLVDDRPSGYNDAAMSPTLGPTAPPDSARSKNTWNISALDENSGLSWRVRIRRQMDGEFIGGQGLAEVFCYYHCFECE